jgi:hypothetical protein
MVILQKLKIEFPYGTITILGSREVNTGSSRNIYVLMFIAALFTLAKMWK